MNLSRPSLLSLLLITSACVHAERGQHVDPLRAISGRTYKQAPTKKKSRTRAPGRHYSPLDALNGRIVVQNKPGTSRHNTPTEKTKKSSNVIHLNVKPVSNSNKTADAQPTNQFQTTVDGMILPPNVVAPLPNAPVSTETKSKHPVEIIVTEHDSENLTEEQLKALMNDASLPAVTHHNAKAPQTAVVATKTYHTPGRKTLFMTFDDGPIRGTANLLRIMKEEDVKATMFYIGREVHHSPRLFHQALAMPNLLIANHTYTHANNHYRRFYNGSVASVVADIDKAQVAIGGAKYLRLCGRNVWRLPSIKRNDWGISVAQRGREIPKYDALHNQGYFIYGWDVEWAFSYKTQKPLFSGEEMARRVSLHYTSHHTAKPGKVIMLAHDFMFRSAYNVQQLRTFIQIMKAQGWTFDTIDNYSVGSPDVYVRTEKKTAKNKLRPSQKLAKKAMMLIPENKPAIATSTHMLPVSHSEIAIQLSEAIRKQSFVEIRRLLANKNADINAKDLHGEIPLNIAIRTNNAVLVRMLVERGARIFTLDASGMSPMGIARERSNTIIIRYLKHQIAIQNSRRLRQTVFASNESIVNE